ncbi:MAG TPA: PTS transporter subunit EIIB [Erysipelotrichaceae bacterium]|nr:PTS transporter subunit EIIB [Erysipelotrichaceae bacterium]
MINSINLPLLVEDNIKTILLIALGVILLIVVVLVVIFFLKKYRDKKYGKNGAGSRKIKKISSSSLWFEAVGGKANVISVVGLGSRLTFYLKDKEKVQRQKLDHLGATSVIVMSNKIILVMENQAEVLAKKLNQDLQQS